MQRTNLKGLSLEELQSLAESLGERKFRGAQLYSWLYAKSAQRFEEMTDLSKEFRALLEASAVIQNLDVVTSSRSADQTEKYLFRLSDDRMIESVLIPPDPSSPSVDRRLTLCVSTQVGCPLDCKFCATGTMGFTRNLHAGEIVDQVLQVQRRSDKRLTNLVFMGMGEPMLNYENVMKAVDIITDDRSLNIGARHITISTAGYADKIRQMADEDRRVKLALSLHTLDNEKRTQLMPITKKFSVSDLIDALDYYYRRVRRRPTLEYILFDGFNDATADIRALVKVSRRVPCKVNLIPYHSIAFTGLTGFGATLRPAPHAHIERFADALRRSEITVMVRSSSGQDINAACGQLAVTHRPENAI